MRLDFSNKETVLVRVILVVALIFAAVSFVQNGGLTGFVPSENRTNSLPVWTGNDSWQTGKNSAFAVDLNNFFSDADNDALTYLATAADKIDVSVQDNLLTVTPATDFVGERTITILASDEFDAVRINVRIIVGTAEERALSPIEDLTNISQPEVLDTTVSSENVSLETEENTTAKTFDVNEKIKDENNKDVGKKLVDETAFETFFTSIEKNESGMLVVFYHNSTVQQPVWIEGGVEYVLSSTVAQPFENISLFVPRIEGIIPKFKLHVGISSDVFEFGKVIPDIVFDGNSTLIDRDDEKIDVLLSKGDASADIRGAYDIPAITAKVSGAEEEILRTDVFAANSMPIDNATISLLKKGRVTAIMECSEFNILTESCTGEWVKADIPFEQNATHITFTVTHFSGYAGADINVLNIQSYPTVGGNWVVEFNTTGTANLTITAFNGTTWTDYSDSGYDLKFLDLKCGNNTVSYSWTGNSVFVQDYNCSSSSFETSKVITEGKHHLKFQFGDDVAYANNFASSWWYYNFDSTYDDYGRAVDFDPSGNVLIGGYGEYLTTPTNLYHWFIIKRNSTSTMWNKSITKDAWGAIYGLAVDLVGNVIVAGDSGGYDNATVTKYNSTGSLLWSINLQMTNLNARAAFYDVALDVDNNITVVGFTDEPGTPGAIFKLNSTGAHLWNVTGPSSLRGVAIDTQNNIIVAGSDSTEGRIYKYDCDGTQLWNTSQGWAYGANNQYIMDVETDQSDNIYAVGGFYNVTQDDFVGAVKQYDSVGSALLWSYTANNLNMSDTGFNAADTTGAFIVATGQAWFNASDPGGAYLYYTVKLDASGALVWNATHSEVNGNSAGDIPYGVAINGIGEIAVTGLKYLLSTMQQNASIGTIKYNPNDVSMPYTTEVIASQSGSNINCYVNATDLDDVNLTAYYYWAGTRLDDPSDTPTLYSNAGLFGKTNITNGTRLLISSVSKNTFAKGYSWRCYAKAFDGSLQQPLWSSSDAIELTATCGDTLGSDTYNFLTADVNTSGTCFTVTGDNITLDCKGYAMRGDRSGSSDNGFDYSGLNAGNVTIKNCMVYNFSNAISGYVRDTVIYNNSFISPGYYGIMISSYGRNNITSNNFTSCSPTGGSSYTTIKLSGSSNNYFINNYIYNSTGYDISFDSGGTYNYFINNTIDVTGRNRTTISSSVANTYNYFENNSIINQGTGTSSWALEGDSNIGFIFVGNNSVNGENLSDIYKFNADNLVFDSFTKGRKNVYSRGQLVIYSCDNVTIKNSVFRNHTTYQINLNTVTNVNITNNSIADAVSSGYGIYGSGVSNLYMANNTIYNNTNPVYFVSGVNNFTIVNNSINTTTGHAVQLSSSATPANINLVVEDNYITSSAGSAIYVTANSALTNISIKNNILYRVSTGISSGGANAKNASIYNNSISMVSSAGVNLASGGSKFNISFNNINCSSGSTSYGLYVSVNSNSIVNNTISHCEEGIYLVSQYNNITSNVMINNTKWGIYFQTPFSSYLRNNITHDNIINGREPYFYYTPGQPVTIENMSLQIGYGVSSGVVTVVDPSQLIFRNNTIMSNGSGTTTGLCPGLGLGNITNSFIEGNLINSTTSSIDVYSAYTGTPSLVFNNNSIANNTFLNTTTYMINLRDGGINNTIINNTLKYSADYVFYTINANHGKEDYTHITQNRIYNSSNAMYLSSSKYTDVDFNDIANISGTYGISIGTSTTEYVTIHDNNFTNLPATTTYGAIQFTSTARNCSAYNNYINNSARGIVWDAAQYANNSAINNRIYGASSAGLAVSIASTSITYAPQNIYNNTVCYGAAAVTLGSTATFNLTKLHNNTFCTKNIYPVNGDTILATRLNVTFNATNVFNTTNTTCILYIDGANNYGSNTTTLDKRNTTIEMTSAVSLGAHILEINCTDTKDNKNLPNSITFTADSAEVAPDTVSIAVNSTYGTNLSNENITCWTSITDPENTSLIAYYAWYNNSVFYSSGTTAITKDTVTNISTLDSSVTTYGENWTCEVRGWDGEKYEADWNNASILLSVGCGETIDRDVDLGRNILGTGSCITIGADDITLNCTGYTITGNLSHSSYGIVVPDSRRNVTVENCYISNYTTAFEVYIAVNITFRNNTATNGTAGFEIQTTADNISIINNTIANMSNTGITSYAANTTIINVRIFNSSSRGIILNGADSVVRGGAINGSGHAGIAVQGNNNVIAGVTFANNKDYGIDLQSGSYHKIVNNTFLGGTTVVIYKSGAGNNLTISNNNITTLAGAVNAGISLLTASNVTIFNNTIEGSPTTAISLNSVNYAVLRNNTLTSSLRDLTIAGASNYTQVIDTMIDGYSIIDDVYYLSLENTTTGKIFYLSNISGIGTDLFGDSGSDIYLVNNSIYVNSTGKTALNVSANITFYNLGWTATPNVYVDRNDDHIFEEKCASPECEAVSYDAGTGRLIFNTTHFTNFTSDTNMPPFQDTPILNSTSGAAAPDNANLTLYPQNASDPDNDKITNITNWFVNSASWTVLNLPFDTNLSVSTTVGAKDYSPYNHLVYGGMVSGSYPVWTSLGISGGAYNFSSADQKEMQVNDSVYLNLSRNFTVELWARPKSIASSTLIGKTEAANENFQIEMDPQGYILFRTLCAPDVVGRWTNSTTKLTANNWYHIVGVHNDSNDRLVLYINGQYENYSTNYADMSGCMATNYLTIGAYSAAGNSLWWDGLLDEIRIYNRSLSPEQILINYNSGQPNYLAVSGKETIVGETWYANITPNDGKEDGITKSSNTVTITEGNAAPNTVQLFINSTYGTNYTNENITCWVNITDDSNTSLVAYFNWYNQSVLYSSGNIAITASSLANISTIDSSLTTVSENWTCEVKGWDGLLNETDWNNASINITNSFPNITYIFTNSSYGMNFTDENITCWANTSDLENTSLIVYYNWYNRSKLVPEFSGSTAVATGVLTAVSIVDHANTTNDTWKCEVRAGDGINNETEWNNATEINVSICGLVTRDFTLTENHITNRTSCFNITVNSTVLNCDNHLISGNITKSGVNPVGDGGIIVKNGYNVTIKYCNLTTFRYGVLLNKSNTIMFVNNSLINNSDGLFIDDSYGIDVIGNVINNQSRKGIVTMKMNHTRIINNTIDYNQQYGIDTIDNIINITIENNSIRGTQALDGIYLQVGRNITIANNIIYNTDDYGINLIRINNISITNNNIDGNNNAINGILYVSCNHTTIHNNTIVNNTDEGIYGYGSTTIQINTVITNNTILNNGEEGIQLSNTNNTVISGNVVKNNSYAGMNCLSNNLSVYNNSVTSNSQYGVYLTGASYVFNISDNIINNNAYYGIYIQYAYTGNVSNNRIFNNSQGGVFLSNTANNKILDNSIFNNTLEGIYFEISENLSIINNSINNNKGGGISSEKSNYANISGNNIANNTDYGIYFFLSNTSNITYNSVSFTGGTGILLNHTVYNRIFQNTVWNNTKYGIGIENGVATATACPEYTCGDGSCIVNAWVCDGGTDCPGGEDEVGCVCSEFTCGDGSCLDNDYLCDGWNDCADGSDEVGCGGPLSWNKVINNTLYNNSVAGIVVVNTDNETIINNTILSCGYYGILLNDTVDSNITRNTVKNHTYSIYLDSSSRNIIYDNYFENEPLADSSSTANNWNISKTLGTNIISGPYLGGNYWAGYNGSDTVAHDGLGDTEVPWRGTAYEIVNGGDYRPLLMIPNTLLVSLNSSFGTNYTNENITCWANLTDPTNTSLIAYFNWYNNSVLYSSGSAEVALEILTNISTIGSSLTTIGENWTCEVKAWDGEYNETGWNNASLVIDNNLPDTTQIIVNSTYGTNYTYENITCWTNSTDAENTSLIIHFNWYNNSVLYSSGSTAVSSNILTNISTINNTVTTINENWTCEAKTWDGYDNETGGNNASLVIDNNLPNTTQIIVNSSLGTNYDTEDITCWVNATDVENTSLIIYFNWYNESVIYSSSNRTVTANNLTNISTIDDSLTTAGENWTCEAKTWDGYDNETGWNNASVVVLAVPATGGMGGGGGGGATRVIYGGVNRSCTESWLCTPMSECMNGIKTRICSDLNNCGSEKTKPVTSIKCEVPKPEPPVEQVIVVPEIREEQPALPEGPSLLSRALDAAMTGALYGMQELGKIIKASVSEIKDLGKILGSGLITAKNGLIIAFNAVEGFLWALPGLIMQNLCFILMLATYITLILAAVFSIVYFLTRNYFENMNKYFGISYVLIALAGLFLMANFVVCKELLTPALLAIAGIVGVFVLDTIVAGVVRQGVDYWIKIKHRQSYESLGDKFQEIAEINRQLDRRWKKEFEKPSEIRIGPPKEGMLKSGLRKTLGEISKFNYLLKRRIESVELPVPKKPEFRWPVFEPRVDYSGAKQLNKKIADIGKRIDSELRETAVKPKIEKYQEPKVEKKKKDIFKPLRKSLGKFRARIFKIEKSAGIGLRSMVQSGKKKLGKAVSFNAKKAFTQVAKTDESISELRKKIDNQLSDSWKNISQIKSRIEDSRKKAVEESERKKRQEELEEKRAAAEKERLEAREQIRKDLEEKRAAAVKARIEAREQLRNDLEERLKKKKFNSLVAREKSMISRLSSPGRARVKEDAGLGKTISSVERFNGLLKKKIEAIKPVAGKEQKPVLELSRNAKERMNKRVSVDYQLALAQAMVEKRRRPVNEEGQTIKVPKNDPEANAVKKTVSRVDRFNELLKKKIDFVKRRKK